MFAGAAHAMPRAEPSQAELEAAWAELLRHGRCRHASLADAMAHAVSAALIRLHAHLAATGAHPFEPPAVRREPVQAPAPIEHGLLTKRPARARKPRRAPPPPRPPKPPTTTAIRQPELPMDRKRLASGDRDDD